MRGADLADEIESLHAMMQLRDRERLVAAGLAQAALGEPRPNGRPYCIGVVAEAVADTSGAPATVAERHPNRVLGLSRHDPDRTKDAAVADDDLDVIAVGNGQALSKRRAHHDDIAPSQRRQRLRQLLQPSDIGKMSVPNRRVGPEDNVEACVRGPLTRWIARRRGADFGRRALDKTVVQRLLPARVEITAERRPPAFAHGAI